MIASILSTRNAATGSAFVFAVAALILSTAAGQEGAFPPGAGGPPGAEDRDAALAAMLEQAAQQPTPTDASGHPDLSGYWEQLGTNYNNPFGGDGELSVNESGEIEVFPEFATVANVNALDYANVDRRREDKSLRPRYKPEYQSRADELFEAGDLNDPSYGCALPGVPRIGPPREIVQTADAVYLLYEDLVNRFRVIPTDGRAHDPDAERLPNGNAVGHWEDDTLVIDVRNITGDTWLDRDGSFHSEDTRVVERLTREGNTLRYELTVEDPFFAEPFQPAAQTFVLAEEGKHILDEWACVERSADHMQGPAKH